MEMFFRSAYYEVVTAMGMIRRMYAALSQYGSLPDELAADMKQTLAELVNAANYYQNAILDEVMVTESLIHQYEETKKYAE